MNISFSPHRSCPLSGSSHGSRSNHPHTPNSGDAGQRHGALQGGEEALRPMRWPTFHTTDAHEYPPSSLEAQQRVLIGRWRQEGKLRAPHGKAESRMLAASRFWRFPCYPVRNWLSTATYLPTYEYPPCLSRVLTSVSLANPSFLTGARFRYERASELLALAILDTDCHARTSVGELLTST